MSRTWLCSRAHLVVHDLPVGFHQGLGVERSFSVQHLVHADAQRPPVALGAVLAFAVLHGLQDLRGDVVRGPHGHRGLDLDRTTDLSASGTN